MNDDKRKTKICPDGLPSNAHPEHAEAALKFYSVSGDDGEQTSSTES